MCFAFAPMLAFGQAPTCGGTFFDSGGATADYSANELIVTTICPVVPGEAVTVTFTAFDTETNFDFLTVFDGNSTAAANLGIFSGTAIPGPFTSTAADGCLTFEFDSDGSVQRAGWEATVSCAPPPSCPAPSSVTATNITDISVDVAFAAPNGQSLFEVLLFAPGANPLTATPLFTMTGSTSPVSFTGLMPNTTYDAYVRTDCSAAAAGVSDLAGPATFTTAFPAPANDDCVNATPLPVQASGACAGNEVTLNLSAATDSDTGNPTCDNFGVNLDVWFSFVAPATGGIVFNTNSTSVEAAVFDDCAQTTQLFCSSGFTDGLMLTGLTPNTTYILNIWQDDFSAGADFMLCIEAIASCLPPTALSTSNVSTTGADISFTANDIGSHTIEYGVQPLTPGSGTIITVPAGSSSASLTGLLPNTTYDFIITADCGSTVSGPASFTTQPPPPACGGNFYDSGGPTNDYSANDLITTTICPDVPTDAVTVTFTAFDTEAGFDDLTVYDGDDTSAPNLGTFDGTGIPGPFTSTAASGCLTFVFDSDGSVQRAGWEANVTCAPASVPLPVELASFNAYAADNGNIVEWTAATEIDFYMYTVERATNPTSFSALAEVAPKGTAYSEAVYTSQDLNPSATTYYRLRMEDLDGTVEYSDVAAVNRDDIKGGGVRVFPNPARDQVTIDVELGIADNGRVGVVLTDLAGRELRAWNLTAGERTNVSLSGIPAGIYNLSSVSATGFATQRLVID